VSYTHLRCAVFAAPHSLNNNGIGAEGAVAIAVALKDNMTLTCLAYVGVSPFPAFSIFGAYLTVSSSFSRLRFSNE
jgi:hypothetical protein